MTPANNKSLYATIVRAGLSSSLRHHLKVATDTLEEYRRYHQEIAERASLTPDLRRIHEFLVLVGYLAQLEDYATSVTADLLASFPEKMEKKEILLSNILTAGSTRQFLRKTAEQKARSLWKGSFQEMVRNTLGHFDGNARIEEDLLCELDEMKCKRNCFVHNGGKADETYIARLGCKEREIKAGDRIEPPRSEDVHRAVSLFVQKFHDRGPSRYLKWGKARAFREMWEATKLEGVFRFDDVWECYPEDDMVSPKDLPHQLSYGEQILYDFFLGIFNPDLPEGKARREWLVGAMQYDGLNDDERKIVEAWKEAPFFF
jgi:hypothetical protein